MTYSKNIARSLLKEPKIYFFDNGLVNGDEGAKLENAVAVCLLKHVYAKNDYLAEPYALHYLRTKDKLEVDDVVRLMELKEEYFKIVGIYREEGKQSICTYPIELNEDEMNLYIISNAVRFEIILSVAQMVGSVFYLTQNSLSIWRR